MPPKRKISEDIVHTDDDGDFEDSKDADYNNEGDEDHDYDDNDDGNEGSSSKKRKTEKASAKKRGSSAEDKNAGGSGSGDVLNGEPSFDLGKKKRATVSKFRNYVMVNIREYYEDSNGDLKPGKKGITLSVEQWEALKSKTVQIDAALKKLK